MNQNVINVLINVKHVEIELLKKYLESIITLVLQILYFKNIQGFVISIIQMQNLGKKLLMIVI